MRIIYLFLYLLFFINIGFSADETEIDRNNYVRVYIWKPKVPCMDRTPPLAVGFFTAPCGGSVGHVSLEIIENGISKHYLSLWPSVEPTKNNKFSGRGKFYEETYEKDCFSEDGREADTIVNLYSLDRERIISRIFPKNAFDLMPINKKTFNLLTFSDVPWAQEIMVKPRPLDNKLLDEDGKQHRSWSLVNDKFGIDNHYNNCSSFVLDLLKCGSIENLFPDRSPSFIRRSLGVISSTSIVIGGTLLGGVLGSLASYSVIYYTNIVFGFGAGLYCGKLNYTNILSKDKERTDCLSDFMVTPSQLEHLVKEAKFFEKHKFEKTKNWK